MPLLLDALALLNTEPCLCQESGRVVALLFENAPTIVNLFSGDHAGWTSAGEVRACPECHFTINVCFGGSPAFRFGTRWPVHFWQGRVACKGDSKSAKECKAWRGRCCC